MLQKCVERQRVAEAARRIEASQKPENEYSDPAVAAAYKRWTALTAAVKQARDALDAAIAARRERVNGADRRLILDAKRTSPKLVLLESDGELLPARCIVSGLAICADDDLYGDPETGAVLKEAVAGNFRKFSTELAAMLLLTAAAWTAFANAPTTPFIIVGLSA